MSSEKRPKIDKATSDLCHVYPLTSNVCLQSQPERVNKRIMSVLFIGIYSLPFSITSSKFITYNTFSII